MYLNQLTASTVGLPVYAGPVEGTALCLLQPNEELKNLQNQGNFTRLMVLQKELKTAPIGEIWAEYCRRCGAPEDGQWLDAVEKYESDVLI